MTLTLLTCSCKHICNHIHTCKNKCKHADTKTYTYKLAPAKTLSNTDKLLWLAITVLCAPCESYKHIYHFLCYNYYLYIYIFTNTPLFIDIMFDPVIFVEQVYMADEKKSPRCLHQWNPHDGKPLSALFFLDNHKNPTPE